MGVQRSGTNALFNSFAEDGSSGPLTKAMTAKFFTNGTSGQNAKYDQFFKDQILFY
jgi:hypothetical protein